MSFPNLVPVPGDALHSEATGTPVVGNNTFEHNLAAPDLSEYENNSSIEALYSSQDPNIGNLSDADAGNISVVAFDTRTFTLNFPGANPLPQFTIRAKVDHSISR